MSLVIGKSKPLVPKPMKVIKHVNQQKKYIDMATSIATEFGKKSRKQKKIIFR